MLRDWEDQPDNSQDEVGHGLTVEQLTQELLETREKIAQLRDHEKLLVAEIHETATERKTETSFGRVETSKRFNRRWDHDEVVRHLTRVALDQRQVDPETGELLDIPTWERVTAALRDCAGISYWKITALKDYGLDPDEFSETTSASLSVRIQ